MSEPYKLEPYDPSCGRFASEMSYLDSFWAESQQEFDETPPEEIPIKRVQYVLREEGTLNTSNGHFLCDSCYIKAGMPSSPSGWVCP